MRSPKEPLSRSPNPNSAGTRTTALERHFHAPSCDSLCQARSDYCFAMVKEASSTSRLGLPVFVLSDSATRVGWGDCIATEAAVTGRGCDAPIG